MPLISVIIPILHTPTIDQTISAVERQSLDQNRYEVIVVGMDRYNQVQENKTVRFDRSSQPLSPARARNRGAAQARGDILVFTDADCIAAPSWLSIFAQDFADSAVTVVGGGVEVSASSYWRLADNISMFYDHLAILPKGTRLLLPSLNLAVRRTVFEQVSGFDEFYPRPSGEDADLSIRLRRKGHTLHFDPRAVVVHHPPRDGLLDLLRHGYYQGRYSTKMDERYQAMEGLPFPLNFKVILLLGAPFVAGGAAARIFIRKSLWRYWPTLPAVYLSKLAWCAGAVNHARRRGR